MTNKHPRFDELMAIPLILPGEVEINLAWRKVFAEIFISYFEPMIITGSDPKGEATERSGK